MNPTGLLLAVATMSLLGCAGADDAGQAVDSTDTEEALAGDVVATSVCSLNLGKDGRGDVDIRKVTSPRVEYRLFVRFTPSAAKNFGSANKAQVAVVEPSGKKSHAGVANIAPGKSKFIAILPLPTTQDRASQNEINVTTTLTFDLKGRAPFPCALDLAYGGTAGKNE